MDDVDKLRADLMYAISSAGSTNVLNDVRVLALGKRGSITQLTKTLGDMDSEARKEAGQAINLLKVEIADAIKKKKAELEKD